MKKTLFYTLFIFLILIFTLCSCDKFSDEKISRGIYYWKGDIQENTFSGFYSFFKTKKIDKIYFKLYDVVWDDIVGIYPSQGPFELSSTTLLYEYYSFIPCVFISNDVFIKSKNSEIELMADRIVERVNSAYNKSKEIQIDCDWSKNSKEKYFYFLKVLKSKLNKEFKLTATIRLFQFKNPELAGIPPVDRGALMLYNFNSPKTYSLKNSIFNESEARKYISDDKYPIKLDFILPAFEWAVVYNQGKFVSLVHETDSTFINDTVLFKPLHDQLYQFKCDTVINEIYYREGNILKLETIKDLEIFQAYDLIDEFKNSDDYTISIFSLNPTLQHLKNETTQKVFKLDHQ